MSSCLAIAAIGLIAPRPAVAAALIINDAGTEPNIVFTVNDYEGGFVLDGTTIQSGLNNQQSVTVSEGTAASGPITHSFSGHWITGGLVPASSIIAFAENGIPPAQGVSDILTFTYTAGGLGGNLTGTFESDIDPGLLPLPAGATVVAEGTPFVFNNGNITASAVSDLDAVPEPATLALLSTALLGFGFLRRRREGKE
jgi:hypothetical protein